MDITGNPWSFVPADIATNAITASPTGLIMAPTTGNAAGPGLVTLLATAGLNAAFVAFAYVTIIGATNAAYNGCYRIMSASGSTLILQPITPTITPNLAASGGGNVYLCLYFTMLRAEDIQWEKPTAGDTMDIRDRNGKPIWQGNYPTGSTAPSWNRGKLMWVEGFTPISLGTSPAIVLVTVN